MQFEDTVRKMSNSPYTIRNYQPADFDKFVLLNIEAEKLKPARPEFGRYAELHSEMKVPLAVHDLDAGNLPSPPDIILKDGDTISVGELRLEVIHTPGHTPGSLCFRVGRYLISGDTIFTAGPGKTRSPDTLRQIIKSITEKIFILPDDTQIYPGHGDSTVLKKEKDEFAVFSSRPHNPDLCGDVVWLSS